MDDFEQRLKRDAEGIPAEITPTVAVRLRASLAAQAAPGATRSRAITRSLWVATGLAGAAAAFVALALLPRAPEPPSPAPVEVASLPPVPARDATTPLPLPLAVAPAELTAPLEQELDNLRADLEHARRRVVEDMSF